MEHDLLEKVKSPDDIKSMSLKELEILCEEIRKTLVNTASVTGGHLASNLGVVELTVALHKVFNSPCDKLIFDVGHQCYTHKILTGRFDKFHTLRQEDGISGFLRPAESEHDVFVSGHASTSISVACGFCTASILSGENNHVISIIGDGSFTGGMAYEALNNAGNLHNLIVILNHNEMSISKNVGSFARYITKLRTRPIYMNAKSRLERFLDHVPIIGKKTKKFLITSKSKVKNIVLGTNFFTDLGFIYYGPIDGHNLKELINVFEQIKNSKGPFLLNITTTKGKGYEHAEENPGAFHGVNKFDVETGNPDCCDKNCFSTVFGQELTKLAYNDKKICAITAAMKYGTGLQYFSPVHKNRFFDVGIAEQHAVTFAGGLAKGGYTPVFAVYSSFLQRGYDQIIHDIAIDGQKVVFAVDRAGVVPSDGETHQGIFDTAFLSNIPNVTIYSPSSYKELEIYLHKAIYDTKALSFVRYPRGKEPEYTIKNPAAEDFTMQKNNGDILLITYGRLYSNVYKASLMLKEDNIKTDIMKLNKITPLNNKAIKTAAQYKHIYFYEEGIKTGGIGEHFLYKLNLAKYKNGFTLTGIDDEFIPVAEVDSILKKLKLDANGIYRQIKNNK